MRKLASIAAQTTCLWIAPIALAQVLPPPPPRPAPPTAPIQLEDEPVFGVSVYMPGGLTGKVFNLKENTGKLPSIKKLKPIATIFTQSLNVTPRDFSQGFPGVPDVFEWFAIDYTGLFWIETPGPYHFFLTSDDGARLYIDDHEVIDNNGQHPPQMRDGKIKLKRGEHSIHVEYFQGPRYQVALVLEVIPPDGRRRVFTTREFMPPPGSPEWDHITHATQPPPEPSPK